MTDKVLLTGASGFIGKHLLRVLLKGGYEVTGTVRSGQKADSVKRLMQKLGTDTSRLSFELLDLTRDAGWMDAARDCRYIHHVASPFPMGHSKDREALVPPARDGALRVLNAAIEANAERFIFTASVVSMMYTKDRTAHSVINENSWTDPEDKTISAYVVSKTRAEQAVWQRAKQAGFSQSVTSLHPGLVFGPALDETIGTSLKIIKLLLKGKYPAMPNTALPVVDVRDVADLHLRAMTTPETQNRRLITADRTLTFPQIATILRKQFPDNRKLPKMTAPDFLVRGLAFVDPSLKSLIPDLGMQNMTDTAYVTELTGHSFRSSRQAVMDAARSLYDEDILQYSPGGA